MVRRTWWQERIAAGWKRAPVVWLSGVRRVGKTTLTQQVGEVAYVNCDLPRNRRMLEDPETYFRQLREERVVLDEIHRLEDPSGVLKVGADEFPEKRILATGSSTLAATAKFRDSLTGRKREVTLFPVLAEELNGFGNLSLVERLRRGGLPQPLLTEGEDPEFFQEWLDSYYARDVQELFAVNKRTEFLKLIELLLGNNGGLLEVTSLARQTGLTRPTVMSYLEILEVTHLVRRLRPFHGGGRRELLSQQKAYGFDTGFVCAVRGWGEIRPEDCGGLLENLVLDTIRAHRPAWKGYFWRDKQQREIDFVLPRGKAVDALECKWRSTAWEARNLSAFRSLYPVGKNVVVASDEREPQIRLAGKHEVVFCGPEFLGKFLEEQER